MAHTQFTFILNNANHDLIIHSAKVSSNWVGQFIIYSGQIYFQPYFHQIPQLIGGKNLER